MYTLPSPCNIPTVNHTITQDPYTKEYTINIAIKIKPETVIKEIKAVTLGPTTWSKVAPLESNIKASKLDQFGIQTLDLSSLNKNPLPAINPLNLQKLQESVNMFNKNHPYF